MYDEKRTLKLTTHERLIFAKDLEIRRAEDPKNKKI
jgi:hypothetical protein